MRWMPGLELGDVVWLCLVLIVRRAFGIFRCIMSLLAEDRIWKQGAEVFWKTVFIKMTNSLAVWKQIFVQVQKGMQHTPRRLTGQSEDLVPWWQLSKAPGSPTALKKRGQSRANFPEVLPQLSQESFAQGNGQTEISPFGSMMHFIAKTCGADELSGYGKNAVPSGRRLGICTIFYNICYNLQQLLYLKVNSNQLPGHLLLLVGDLWIGFARNTFLGIKKKLYVGM